MRSEYSHSPGSPSSVYVRSTDGARLALDLWLPVAPGRRRPVVLTTTRYWRAFDTDAAADRQPAARWARVLAEAGIVHAVADARGTGASEGMRDGPFASQETADLRSIIDWLARQPWSNGRVACLGTSFAANMAMFAAASGAESLVACFSRFPDFDLFRHTVCPGGVAAVGLNRPWSSMIRGFDSNDFELAMHGRSATATLGMETIRGVRPVPGHEQVLAHALQQRRHNFDYAVTTREDFTYFDRLPTTGPSTVFADALMAPLVSRLENSAAAIVYWAGWFDAGTAAGALAFFRLARRPMRVIIGPWNHGMSHVHDPLNLPSPHVPVAFETRASQVVDFAAAALSPAGDRREVNQTDRRLDYYVLGEGWRTTADWPPAGIAATALYLGTSELSSAPLRRTAWLRVAADGAHTTGSANRWTTQVAGAAVDFPDRLGARGLRTWMGAPLDGGTIIVGSVVANLWIRASDPDATLFVYLEVSFGDSIARLLTEGQIRLRHHREAQRPAYDAGGPFHTCAQADAADSLSTEPFRVALTLFPTAVRLPTGSRLRLSIAAGDAATFAPARRANGGFDVVCGADHDSHILLPLDTGALKR